MLYDVCIKTTSVSLMVNDVDWYTVIININRYDQAVTDYQISSEVLGLIKRWSA